MLEVTDALSDGDVHRLCLEQHEAPRHGDFIVVLTQRRFAVMVHHLGEDEVREMTSMLRQANELRPRVERCEHDIEDLKRRVG